MEKIIEFSDVRMLYGIKVSSILKQFTGKMGPLNVEETKEKLDKLLGKNDFHEAIIAYKENNIEQNKYYLDAVFNSKLLIHKVLKDVKEKYEGRSFPPFNQAACDGTLNDVLILLDEDEGMDINEVGGCFSTTALFAASFSGNIIIQWG